MEAKLKSLRVADLRELLQKASVPIPTKSNKSDLIAKVLASPAALQAFESQGSSAPTSKLKVPESSQAGQDDDLLAPPEEFDWGSASATNGGGAPPASTQDSTTTVKPHSGNAKATAPDNSTQPEQKRPTQAAPSNAPVTSAPSSGKESSKTDEELEKRKKRAARFGIALVEPKTKSPRVNGAKQTLEDATKLEARAARFELPTASSKSSPGSQKRGRSPAAVDNEEMERRKKRAERFSSETKKTQA